MAESAWERADQDHVHVGFIIFRTTRRPKMTPFMCSPKLFVLQLGKCHRVVFILATVYWFTTFHCMVA